MTNQGLGAKTGVVGTTQRLLLSGCSAGARGAMMNLDYVSGILTAAGVAAGVVEVQGLLDSPLWVDVAPATPHIMPLVNETQAIYALVNPLERLGPLCDTTYPAEEDRWKCLFGCGRPGRTRTCDASCVVPRRASLTRLAAAAGNTACRCCRRRTC